MESTHAPSASSIAAARRGAAMGAAPWARTYWPWLLAILIALALPWAFFNWSSGRHSGFVLTMLSEIGLMAIFALSFNMQMGQAGLLSFGHAILFGLGGYCTAHALNAIKAGALWLPTELVPLVGGLGGLLFGILFGFIATKQRATAFAMITLGFGELVAAAALMFMGFFGGEGGISTNRVTGVSLIGASYSASWQVYYLVVAWTVIAALLMRLQIETPLGRLANATRDNFERAQFVGYDPRMVRFYQFVLSGFFAGIAGGLYAILYEIVTFDAVAAPKSATALLATYIGGVGGFFGPILGTILIVLLQSGVSLISNAWLLYVGVLFIVMVMFAPEGLLGLIAAHAAIARSGRLGRLTVPYVRVLLPGLLLVAAFVLLVEMASFVTILAGQGKPFVLGSIAGIDPFAVPPWIAAAACLGVAGLWLRQEARAFGRVWDELSAAVTRPPEETSRAAARVSSRQAPGGETSATPPEGGPESRREQGDGRRESA
jgi:branched-chain amino acid transport system permease protein